jgi:hypothetical protein
MTTVDYTLMRVLEPHDRLSRIHERIVQIARDHRVRKVARAQMRTGDPERIVLR